MKKPAHSTDTPVERLSGSVEQVTFRSEQSGFCVLCAKVRGQHELLTVIGSAASITAGKYMEGGSGLTTVPTECNSNPIT